MRLVTFTAAPNPAPRAGFLLDGQVMDAGRALEEMLLRGRHLVPEPLRHLLGRSLTAMDLVGLGPADLRRLGGAIAEHLHPGNARACPEPVEGLQPGAPSGRPWVFPAPEVTLKAPLPRPNTIRDFYAFEAHVKRIRDSRHQEMPAEWYELPAFYFTNPGAVFGPGDEIPYPAPWTALDYELESACVIGRAGIDIPEGQAEEYIAGYTIMNDWSARDIQQKEMRVGLGPAKGKDFATSLGPSIVTQDELESYREGPGRYALDMTARVNGKLYSRGSFKDIHWTFPQMIAWASRNAWLYPGDVLGSGTVGTGCILELGADKYGWLKPGDTVDLEVEGLGILSGKVGKARQER